MADYSADDLRRLLRQGKALPAPGQSRPARFPIANRADLENAIRAVGRVAGGEAERAMVRRYIMRRARELGLSELIPDTWRADGTLRE